MTLLLLACVVVAPDALDADAPPEVPLRFLDAHNYAYVGALDAPTFPLAARTDVTLDWSALVTDLQCHALDPVADIDNAALLVFPNLGEEEIEAGLEAGTLEQNQLGGYVSFLPGDATAAVLSDFTFFGTDADIETRFDADNGTFLVLITTGTQVGVGARMLAFLAPSETESATEARLTSGCPVLDFDADLASQTRAPILAAGPWDVEWSALTVDGRGGDMALGKIDRVVLARFDDLSPLDLERRFLDLELLADAIWTGDLAGGTTLDLATLHDATGAPFSGFEGGETWIFALRCGTCANPAPLFLTVLDLR